MKFCLHCGKEIEDNVTVCPHCGKSATKNTSKLFNVSSSQNLDNGNSDQTSNTNMKVIIFILTAIFDIPGLILLIIYGYKEFNFRSEYELSKFSDAGVKLLRETTGNDLNITMIIVSIVLLVLGAIIGIAPAVMKNMKK